MAQFTLNWDNTKILSNINVTAQRASYKLRSSPTWLTTGFTPTNDMVKSVVTADSASGLADNKVYQFKVESICTVNGPTINDNDVQENMNFACIVPTLTHTATSGTIVIDTTVLDITKARLTLKKASDNSIIEAATIVNVVSNAITHTKSGLTGSTNYYWQVELYATWNNVEQISSSDGNLGQICSPYAFTTDAPPVCNPITAGTISSVEIP